MASIIKADNIQKVSDGSNIIKKCGSTITLGSCGATISLAAGATQTGFGQTYSAVEYCTTAKTSPFTAAAGTGYFINTTCGAVTVTLPASPTAGDVVAFKDYAGQWNTNNVTLCNNGNKINGTCATASLGTQNQSVTLIYVDATKGWQDIQDSTAGVTGESYITATGGTITTCGDYKIHTFTSDGTFCVSAGVGPLAKVDYLVVAGGGGGSFDYGSGGGAGGFRLSNSTCMPAPLTSPLANPTGLPVSVTSYPITVGGGGAFPGSPAVNPGVAGSNSVFNTITSAGGGGGAGASTNPAPSGGSGAGAKGTPGGTGGTGNTPPTSPPQGNPGGDGQGGGSSEAPGGGGGAGAAGQPGITACRSGNGGAGSYIVSTGFGGSNGEAGPVCGARYFAGGGGGGGTPNIPAGFTGVGGVGGGGDGSSPTAVRPQGAGISNTGGGGGGGNASGVGGGAGGSGIVIIRYKFQ
jgi:hypothetical protein